MSPVAQWLAALLIAGLLPASAAAQPLAGAWTISGMVRDVSGAAVPDAEVQVDNDERGIRWNVKTDRSGVFKVPAIIPAAGYTVTITKAGFAAHETTDVEVLVGEDVCLVHPAAVP